MDGMGMEAFEQLVSEILWMEGYWVTDGHNATVRDGALLSDRMRLVVPSGVLKFGNHKFSAGICFCWHR
jgi:hypothetical protein